MNRITEHLKVSDYRRLEADNIALLREVERLRNAIVSMGKREAEADRKIVDLVKQVNSWQQEFRRASLQLDQEQDRRQRLERLVARHKPELLALLAQEAAS